MDREIYLAMLIELIEICVQTYEFILAKRSFLSQVGSPPTREDRIHQPAGNNPQEDSARSRRTLGLLYRVASLRMLDRHFQRRGVPRRLTPYPCPPI